MIKLENFEVLGWDHAIRGMRNPMNSWDKSDSSYCGDYETCGECPAFAPDIDGGDERYCSCYSSDIPGDPIMVGENDHNLMMRLAKGGSVHAKYRRMITVYVDITAPLYWWKEFDTYKVGTVANSCSTMHKIHEKEFTLDDFSHERLFTDDDVGFGDTVPLRTLECVIYALNEYRRKFNEYKAKPMKNGTDRAAFMKRYFDQMIQLLPSSYNQKRTVMLNYEVLTNIYEYRKNHKLDEWVEFCQWIERLPYSEIITGNLEEEK